MQIFLQNEIDFDGQMEVIKQVFAVEVKQKGDFLYLLFQNDEKEKVVVKCSPFELTMTRFSEPKSTMRFLMDKEAIVTVPTPMGVQHFVTATHRYRLSVEEQEIHLSYDLKALDSGDLFATYNMVIQWK